jgi:hypothetical protein
MAHDPISQEMARLVNEKLDRVIGKQTEHTIALANHTASLDRLERDVSQIKDLLRQLVDGQHRDA